MVKSFIDAVQDSSRSRLGIPVETKNPLSRTNTGRGTTFRNETSWAIGFGLLWITTLS